MAKTLQAIFSPSPLFQETKNHTSHRGQRQLYHLLLELDGHLQQAGQDLLQPREKAVNELLTKVLMTVPER